MKGHANALIFLNERQSEPKRTLKMSHISLPTAPGATGGSELSTQHTNPPRPKSVGGSSSQRLPPVGVGPVPTHRRGTSPLTPGRYESAVLDKLLSFHEEGFNKNTMKANQLRNEDTWEDHPEEPPGRHVSQRSTVGSNMVFPKRERADQHDTRAVRIARHRANSLMMTFEKEVGRNWNLALDSLVEARFRFAEARDTDMVVDLEALLARVHGDRALNRAQEARQAADFAGCEACVEEVGPV